MPESSEAAAAAATGQERMANILSSLKLSFMGESSDDDSSSETGDSSEAQLENDLPVPHGILKAHVQSIENEDQYKVKMRDSPKVRHECDSGLGTSVSKSQSISASDKCKGMQSKVTSLCGEPNLIEDDAVEAGQLSVEGLQAKATKSHLSAITRSISSFDAGSSTPKHHMSDKSIEEIHRTIIDPILKEERLKPFHPLAKNITHQIAEKQIVCLRDLEKTLLWVAPVSGFLILFKTIGVGCMAHFFSLLKNYSRNNSLMFFHFAGFAVRCLHKSTYFVSEQDQRLPSDQPYTNGYFRDLLEQIRQHAEDIKLNKHNILTKRTSKPKRDTETSTYDLDSFSLLVEFLEANPDTSAPVERATEDNTSLHSLKRNLSLHSVDEGAKRSMARRKKNAPPMDINKKCSSCDKIFKRPCDLTKHEKTHSRPWKCSDETCKYFSVGWPTEKERDRHVNDKHSSSPCVYRCHFPPCSYQSKRESNCKQHMEKAHGWSYVRSKNNGKLDPRGSSMQPTSQSSDMATPSSGPVSIATPNTGTSSSISPFDATMGQQPLDAHYRPFSFAEPPMMNPVHSDGGDFQLYPETHHSNSFPDSAVSMEHYYTNNEELAAFEAALESADPNGMLPYPIKSSGSGSSSGGSNNNSVFESSVPELVEPMGLEGSPTARSESNSSFNPDMDGYNSLEQQNMGMQYPSYMSTMDPMPLMNQRSVSLDAMHPFSCDPALPVPEPLLYNTCQFDEGVYDMETVLRGGFTPV